MESILYLENVTKKYDGFSLDRVSINVPSGCIMGFIGANGAGKTTTIKLILDLIQKDEGQIRVLGQSGADGLRNIKEDIGVVLDESNFPDNMSVKDVNFIMKNIYQTWDEEKFLAMAQRFGLTMDKVVKNYSRGMKMKLSIAVALSHDAKLLILDEATSGLDPIARDEILDVLLDFIQDESHSVFMSSHILSDLEKACDYITFIHKGKIVFSDTKDELLERYGLLKCSQVEFEALDADIVKGYRKNSFGVEALVLKKKLTGKYVIDPASIEDIMLYHVKEAF
jgi:ABC-2 type transport system ATP-binding protein